MPAEFLSPLEVSRVPELGWRLLRPLLFKSQVLNQLICVPAGYITDFASVPRLPLAFLLTGDQAHASAVVHDYLIEYKVVPRKLADRVFAEAMQIEGIPKWRRALMYSAVRMYTAWKEVSS